MNISVEEDGKPVRTSIPVRQIPPFVFKAKLPLAHDFQSGPVDILIECDLMYQVIMWDLASPAGKPTAGN